MSTDVINRDNIFEHLKTVYKECSCDYKAYYRWYARKNKDDLVKCGSLFNGTQGSYDDRQYWDEDAPIIFEQYPYYGCDILSCSKCGRLFLNYREDGGHVPEERIRLIRKELIKDR